MEYLTSVRMEKAMSLLKHSEIKAFEIAEIVGIPDANYFCSCFKKYTGVNVSDFKKSDKTDRHGGTIYNAKGNFSRS